jgi:hypothetical protein
MPPTDINLLPPVLEIIQKVKEVSGKEIVFRPAPDQTVPATSKIARVRMSSHIIKYQPQMLDSINHLTAHECGHILRTMEADPTIRVVPVSNAQTRATATTQLKNELSFLPESIRERMLDMWVGGIIMQLTSLPVCARIESWIHRNYPALRTEQRNFLKSDLRRTLQGVSRKIERNTPPTVFRTSNSITYAYLRAIEPVTGKDFRSHFSGQPDIAKTGKQLYEALGIADSGYAGDLQVTMEWARILNIGDWFAWLNFEEVPESYFNET